MRYPHFPKVGERIKERLLVLGYVRADGSPDIGRFIKEKHYDPRSFYPWTKGRTPAGPNLDRLVQDLQCSRSWLLLGEEVAHPIHGGRDVTQPQSPVDITARDGKKVFNSKTLRPASYRTWRRWLAAPLQPLRLAA